ncbi:MAG: hypothetical protein RDU89_01755 [bacterium]|nr:hypothetical protein [bacterium]
MLIATARIGGLITYGEVAQGILTHRRVVPRVLWAVHQQCVENGWPSLTAVVVSKATQKPGYLSSLTEETEWRRLLGKVYRFDWEAVAVERDVSAGPCGGRGPE